MQQRPLGTSGLSITPVSFGTSGIGNMPDTYGYEVDDHRARETLQAIFNGPINCLDTSNNYGLGVSEQRIGAAIAECRSSLSHYCAASGWAGLVLHFYRGMEAPGDLPGYKSLVPIFSGTIYSPHCE